MYKTPSTRSLTLCRQCVKFVKYSLRTELSIINTNLLIYLLLERADYMHSKGLKYAFVYNPLSNFYQSGHNFQVWFMFMHDNLPYDDEYTVCSECKQGYIILKVGAL